MKSPVVFTLLVLLLVSGCGPDEKRLQVDVSAIQVPEVIIHRYDRALFRINEANLQAGLEAIKPEYRFFLGTNLSDPLKVAEMRTYLQNPRTRDFQKAVMANFSDVAPLERELTEAFRHYRYYFPEAAIPRVYSYISGGDYDYPVQFADSVLIIALDDYLGRDFKAYTADGLPVYHVSRMTPDQILPDCMKTLADLSFPRSLPGNNLLFQMIEAGKRLYFIDAMIPAVDNRFKIGYSQAQYDWIVKNEQHVWAAIIENRILYAADGQLIRTFMADGPFTAEFSQESPARLGEWIGWQIVRRFMANNPDVTFQGLFKEKDAQKILTLSKYKPRK